MIKAIGAIIVVCFGVIYLPLWVQITLFAFFVITLRYRIALLIPAFFADAWYAPVRSLAPSNNKMTLIVIGMLLVYYGITRVTRIRERYGLETK